MFHANGRRKTKNLNLQLTVQVLVPEVSLECTVKLIFSFTFSYKSKYFLYESYFLQYTCNRASKPKHSFLWEEIDMENIHKHRSSLLITSTAKLT